MLDHTLTMEILYTINLTPKCVETLHRNSKEFSIVLSLQSQARGGERAGNAFTRNLVGRACIKEDGMDECVISTT